MAGDNEIAPKFSYLHTTLTSGFNALAEQPMKMDGTASLDRAAMARPGSRVESYTIVWNSLEGVVALVTGRTAGRAFSALEAKPAIIANDKRSVRLPVVTR